MKEKRILNALEHVDEKYIEDAAPAKQKSKKTVWVRWVAVAACLCLAVGIAVPRLTDMFHNKGGDPSQTHDGPDSLVQEISALEFNGAYYEATDIPEALERYGLPTVITENTDQIVDDIVLVDLLNRFLASMPTEKRRIFMRRYWYLSPITEIATDFSVSESKVKMSLLRSRNELKLLLEKEGIEL